MGGCGDRKTPQESAQLTKQLTHSAGMCRHLARSVAETSACVKSHLLKWRQPEMKPKRERRHNVGPRADTQRQNYAHIYPVFRIHMALRGAQMLQFSLRTSPPFFIHIKKPDFGRSSSQTHERFLLRAQQPAPAPQFGHQVGQTGVVSPVALCRQ